MSNLKSFKQNNKDIEPSKLVCEMQKENLILGDDKVNYLTDN